MYGQTPKAHSVSCSKSKGNTFIGLGCMLTIFSFFPPNRSKKILNKCLIKMQSCSSVTVFSHCFRFLFLKGAIRKTLSCSICPENKTKQLLLQKKKKKKKRTNERNRIRGCFLLKMIEITEPRYDNNFFWDTFLKKFLNSSKPNMWGAFCLFFLKGR